MLKQLSVVNFRLGIWYGFSHSIHSHEAEALVLEADLLNLSKHVTLVKRVKSFDLPICYKKSGLYYFQM